MSRPMRRVEIIAVAVVIILLMAACQSGQTPSYPKYVSYDKERKRMVKEQIEERGIKDERVLTAMLKVPRHLFVPEGYRDQAYEDYPLPIGKGQTISQPYIVALMTELARLKPGDKVLEIGTGSGYQAAVLAELGAEVYTIEILPELAQGAQARLKELGYNKVQVKVGDGYFGWEENAPYDAIIITAAPPKIPESLLAQLKIGGRMVVPVGENWQELKLITKEADGYKVKNVIPVRFVPMVGKIQEEGSQ